MSTTRRTRAQLVLENEQLRAQLDEAQETLLAIREGSVDAIVVTGQAGKQIYSLVGTESIYRPIVETMKEAAFTATVDGTILFCNVQFGEMVKRPLEQLVGHPVLEFVTQGDAGAASSFLATAQHWPVKERLVFQAADGTPVPAHVSANLLNQVDGMSICVVASDLTDLENSTELIQRLRRQQMDLQEANEQLAVMHEEQLVQNDELRDSRQDLEQARARYQELFTTAPDGYVVTDPYGKIQEVNPAAACLLGHTDVELRGRPFSRVLSTTARERLLELLAGLRLAETSLSPWEVELCPVGGPPMWAGITVSAARDERGSIVGFRWLIRDITKRRCTEHELAATLDELRRSNDDLQQFAAVASHDLKEPLRVITGFLEILQEEYKPQLDARAQRYIDHAVNGATRMSQIIHSLLEYSRVNRQGRTLGLTDTGSALAEALGNLEAATRETGVMITHDAMPQVMGDRLRLMPLFQNLAANAIKFRSPERPCRIHVGVTRRDDAWEFSVRDNGIGIPPQYFDRIFVIFQRLVGREEYPGTGIGLAICKKIVESHGGRIWVDSTPREGSVFTFTLPAVPVGQAYTPLPA